MLYQMKQSLTVVLTRAGLLVSAGRLARRPGSGRGNRQGHGPESGLASASLLSGLQQSLARTGTLPTGWQPKVQP